MSQAWMRQIGKFHKHIGILAVAGLFVGCEPVQEKPGDCDDNSRGIASVLGLGGGDSKSGKKSCDTGNGGGGGGGSTPAPKPYPFPSNPGKVCTVDRFKQLAGGDEVIKKVDILFVMDHSGSMADDWARVAGNVKNMVKELPKDMDIRYSVLLANASSWKGKLYAPAGIPNVLSNQKLSVNEISDKLGKIFKAGMDQADNIGSGEASFLSLYHAATTHSRDNQKAGFFRADAALSIIFMSDEQEIGSPFPNPQAPGLPPRCDAAYEDKVKLEQYDNKGINLAVGFNALKALKGDMPVITHAFVNITKEDLFTHNDKKAKCLYDSLGYGYFEAVELTKGVLFSIQADKAEGMSRCGKVIKERLQVMHDFKLSKAAEKVDAASIVAAVDGVKQTHDYRAAANSVHLEYAGVPGSTVEIQHCEPVTKVDWNLIGFAGQAGQYAVSLTFKTPEYATTSKVLYGTSASNLASQTSNGARGTDHLATVEGLSPNTLYYFQAVAWDEYGVEKRSSVLSVRTQPDWNLVGAAGQPSRNTISIAWKTPEYATRGKVLWGASSNALVNQTSESPAGNEHVAQVSGLNANTTYYFQCVSRDEYGLEKKSAVLAVKTVTDWGILGFRGQAGQTTASLEWQTPEYPTAGRVLYGTNSGNLNLSAASTGTNQHQVNLADLSPNTVYYFQAVGLDNLGSEKRSAVISLKTQADWNIVGFAGTATQNSVSVSWTTPEYDTIGTLRYGATAESLSNTVSAGNGTAHSATVGDLSPDTLYYFQAVGVDEYGLAKASAVVAVRTEKKPDEPQPLPVWEISDFGTVASKSTIAVAWKTSDYATVGKVLYGTDANALNGEESEVTAVRDHGLEITGLRADTLYYVQAVSVDNRGQEKRTAVTAVRTLADETPEEPPVGNWAIEGFDASTTATAADVIWHTPGAVTKAMIKVGTSASDLSFKEVAVENFAETHLIPVTGLNPNTAYYMQVVAVDRAGRTQESVLIMKRTKAQ